MGCDCNDVRTLEGLLTEWLCSQINAAPSNQIESASLQSYCDASGNIVAFGTVIINESTNATSVKYFDTTLTEIGSLPIGSTLCSSKDVEILEACFREIANPLVKYNRVTLLDTSTTPAVSVGVLWQDSTGAFVAAPAGVEPCNDDVVEVFRTYRLGGTSLNAVATPDIAANGLLATHPLYSATNVAGVDGQSITIPANTASRVAINVLPATLAGGILRVDGIRDYVATSGTFAGLNLPQYGNENNKIAEQKTFEAIGNMFVELTVVYKI